ncbi:MAG: TonB-dependent receptor, partial [Acidobacteriota bacterium]
MRIENVKFRTLAVLAVAGAFMFLALPAYAQYSSVSGKVLDQAGAVIPGVTVALTSSTGAVREVISNDVGVYQFLQVPPGTYSLKAELSGFKTAMIPEVVLLVDTPRTLDLKLEIGELTETVTVEAGAARLNTTDATLGSAFEARRIIQLPLESRNVASLLSLQAAVTKEGYVSGSRSDQSNLTLDGIDVNEQQEGTAFETVLRVNPDSVQEFRVTTNTPTATQGRSSGGQVSLITRTGTNEWHGALYEYHRNTVTTANDFFNNRSGVDRPALIRNLFGGSVSGPVKRDRIFFFYNYEGRRDAKQESVLRSVPTASLGRGEVKYTNSSGGITTLSKEDIARIYPVGYNPLAIATLAEAASKYPANDSGTGDGLNYSGFRFNAPLPVAYNAHTATLAFNLDQSARHILTLRGNYQHDREGGVPQFPDTPGTDTWSHPYGFGGTYTWTVNPKLVNTLRVGLTRQAFSEQGDSADNSISFRFVYSPRRFARTLARVTPVWNIVDDLSWVSGNHTWQFGTNIRFIRNERVNYGRSYDSAITNPSFYEFSGAVLTNPLPDIAGSIQGPQAGLTAVIGRYSQYSGNYNFGADGDPLSPGTGVQRRFATEEYEFYAQDTWRVRRDLTLTLGIRYSLNTPVYETNGLEVKPTTSLNNYFETRKAYAASGVPYYDSIEVDLSGPANNRPGLYEYDKNNFAPRAAFAWTPDFENGFLRKIFGTGQKSVLRGGFSMAYDRIGSRLAVSFDNANTLGFSSQETIAANTYNVSDRPAPLFTGYNQNIRALPGLTTPSKLVFPKTTRADGAQRIESSLDDALTTPVNYSWNFSLAREFGAGLTLEASYIGRAAKNLLATRDIMALNNLVDKKSGMDWYTAAGMLYDLRAKEAPIETLAPIPYFENLFPGYRTSTLSPTQRIYRWVARDAVGGWEVPDYTYIQLVLDDQGIYRNAFFQPQYAALTAFSTVATSDYHAGTLSLRQRLSSFNFDLNYTFSKSIDTASGLQTAAFYGSALILNPLRPEDNRG